MSNLETLYSDYLALRQQFADVEKRKEAADADYEERRAKLYEEWVAANAELLAECADVEQAYTAKDKEVRAAIVEAYLANPESKTVAPGLSVRVNTSLKYDVAKALEWAKEHQLALALDKKAFEAIAKAQPMDFVETIEMPSAVIKGA